MKKTLAALPGVTNVNVDFETKIATCTYEGEKFDGEAAIKALDSENFTKSVIVSNPDSPENETVDSESPATETTENESPAAESPEAESSEEESPAAESPAAETPAAKAPEEATPEGDKTATDEN